MKVRSVRFGEFEVGDETVIHFPDGIAPFGKGLDFVLLAGADGNGRRGTDPRSTDGNGRRLEACATRGTEADGNGRRLGSLRHGTEKAANDGGRLEGQELAWLQSLQLPELGFWVGHAGKLFPERDMGIEAHHLQSVGVERAEQLCIVLILTIEEEQVTANLLAPVLVNTEAGIGRQVVVSGSIEQVRVPVPACRVAAQAV